MEDADRQEYEFLKVTQNVKNYCRWGMRQSVAAIESTGKENFQHCPFNKGLKIQIDALVCSQDCLNWK